MTLSGCGRPFHTTATHAFDFPVPACGRQARLFAPLFHAKGRALDAASRQSPVEVRTRQVGHPPVSKNDFTLLYCASLGAAVPSDHVDTGIMYSVIGSGAPANCGFNITGVPGKSAPHDLGSVSGT